MLILRATAGSFVERDDTAQGIRWCRPLRLSLRRITMAKAYYVWETHWELCEYGGLSSSTESSYHLTREEAESYKERHEQTRPGWPQDDPFSYKGSKPSLKLVGKAEYKRIKENSQKP
jgi:hypothetical protein